MIVSQVSFDKYDVGYVQLNRLDFEEDIRVLSLVLDCPLRGWRWVIKSNAIKAFLRIGNPRPAGEIVSIKLSGVKFEDAGLISAIQSEDLKFPLDVAQIRFDASAKNLCISLEERELMIHFRDIDMTVKLVYGEEWLKTTKVHLVKK